MHANYQASVLPLSYSSPFLCIHHLPTHSFFLLLCSYLPLRIHCLQWIFPQVGNVVRNPVQFYWAHFATDEKKSCPIFWILVPAPASPAYHPLQHDGGLIDGIREGDVWPCDRALIYTVAVAWYHMWFRWSTWLALPQYVQCSHSKFVGCA